MQVEKTQHKDLQMIVFQLGLEEYAVPITAVQEIIMPQKPTRIPKSPAFVEGIINLRGQIIPIIDGRKKFNLLSDKEVDENVVTEDTRIMLLEVSGDTIGLVVDKVSEVIHLNTASIEPPPADVGLETDYLYGVGKFESRLLILLKIENFLTNHETSELKDVTKTKEVASDKMLAYSGE
ncbi:MAG: chemotaxis protein CheW [Vampirovibrionia bacterium]